MRIFTFLFLILSFCGWVECSNNFSDLKREYDHFGRLIKEQFPNGKSIEISYDEKNRVVEISIDESGRISYKYNDSRLLEVSRSSPSNEIMYTHSYEYDGAGALLHEELISDLGRISYEKDLNKKFVSIESPYSQEVCKFNSRGLVTTHFLDQKPLEYDYDNWDQLISFETEERPLLEYDSNGNLIKKISKKRRCCFEFDQQGKLIQAITDRFKVRYFYDDLDRRVAKKIQKNEKEETETYLYFGKNEIAVYGDDGALKQLRIPGLSFDDNFILPIAIETKDHIYAAIHDYRGNLTKLINIKNQEITSISPIDPFGQNLERIVSPTPWLFASKHYDDETNLVYFGSRYYDPEIKQWITPDPFGTLQHSDVYLYCLGNPLSYFDPDGNFAFSLVSLAWGAGAALSFPVWGTGALIAAAGAATGWATYEIIQKVKEGKQRDGTPGWNGSQNDQFNGAVKEIEKKIGKKLDKDKRKQLHQHISQQDYGYHEIVEEGYWLFK